MFRKRFRPCFDLVQEFLDEGVDLPPAFFAQLAEVGVGHEAVAVPVQAAEDILDLLSGETQMQLVEDERKICEGDAPRGPQVEKAEGGCHSVEALVYLRAQKGQTLLKRFLMC